MSSVPRSSPQQLGQPGPARSGVSSGRSRPPGGRSGPSATGSRRPRRPGRPRRTVAWSPRPLTNSSTRRDLPTPAEPRTLTRWQVPSAAARSNSRAAAPARGSGRSWARLGRAGPAVGQELQQAPDLLRLGRALDVSGPAGSALTASATSRRSPRRAGSRLAPARLLEPLGQVHRGAGELLLEGAGVTDSTLPVLTPMRMWNSRPRWRLTSLASSSMALRGARWPPSRPAGRRPRAGRTRRRRP